MSSRIGYALAVLLLLAGAWFRLWQITTLPAGLHAEEITDIRLAESVKQGNIQVLYDLGGEGREGLYHAGLAMLTGLVGSGLLGYTVLSLWVGMMALAVTYALAARLFGPLVGVLALALLVPNLWLIILSRHITREALLPLLVVAVILALARTLSVYRDRHPRLPENTVFVLLGVLLGVGIYIHPAHLMLVLFSMTFILYRFRSRRELPPSTIAFLLFSLLLMIIIAMPYLITSLRLPGLSGAARVFDGAGVSPITALINSLGGIFFLGDSNAAHNVPGRPLLDLASGLLVLLGLLRTVLQWRESRYALLLLATLVLLPTAVLSAHAPDFPALTPLVPLLGIYFGLGAVALYQSVVPRARALITFGLVVIIGGNVIWAARDLFQIWPGLPEMQTIYSTRYGQLAHYLDQTAGDIPTVICDSQLNDVANDELSGADLMLLMMNRKTAELRFADCGSSLIFVNGGGQQQIILPEPDLLAKMPSYLYNWMTLGEVVAGLPIDSVVRLDVSQTLADTIGRFTTTAPAGFAPDAPGEGGLATPPVRFGGNIAFLGYEQTGEGTYPPGGIVTTITYWRVDGEVPPDLRLFTHILSDPTVIAAQNDTISVDVRQLQSRDIFIQIMFVPLPITTLPGTYTISVGAYTASNDERMPVLDNDQPRGNRLFLGQITVG